MKVLFFGHAPQAHGTNGLSLLGNDSSSSSIHEGGGSQEVVVMFGVSFPTM